MVDWRGPRPPVQQGDGYTLVSSKKLRRAGDSRPSAAQGTACKPRGEGHGSWFFHAAFNCGGATKCIVTRGSKDAVGVIAAFIPPCAYMNNSVSKRPKKSKSLTIVQYNGNAWRSLQDYAAINKSSVICGQETKLAVDALVGVRRVMACEKWAVSFAPALQTQETSDQRCRSAGAMVAVPAHILSAEAWPFNREDLAPSGAPCRLPGRWLPPPGGTSVLRRCVY